MALTAKQKEELRAYICSKGKVTPEILAEYSAKTDEEVIALLAADKAKKLEGLTASLKATQSSITSIQAEINKLRG